MQAFSYGLWETFKNAVFTSRKLLLKRSEIKKQNKKMEDCKYTTDLHKREHIFN